MKTSATRATIWECEDDMTNEAVYVISVAARLTGVHPQTLRIYERRGLLSPHRTPGGTRRYSDADIERMKLIQQLTGSGVNIEGVKRILALQAEVDRLDHHRGSRDEEVPTMQNELVSR